jgi:hypothetical protein
VTWKQLYEALQRGQNVRTPYFGRAVGHVRDRRRHHVAGTASSSARACTTAASEIRAWR